MELGADAVLMNTAIAGAQRPGADGARDAAGGGSRPPRVPGRPDSAADVRDREQPARRARGPLSAMLDAPGHLRRCSPPARRSATGRSRLQRRADRRRPAVAPLRGSAGPRRRARRRQQVDAAQRVVAGARAGHALPPARGVRSRLAHFVWRLVAPAFERQQAFNARAGRSREPQRRSRARRAAARVAATARRLPRRRAALRGVPVASDPVPPAASPLYVDTEDRFDAAQTDVGLRRRHQRAHRRTAEALGVGGRARSAVRRHGSRGDGLGDDDLRATLPSLQQATLTLKRELERGARGAHGAGGGRAGCAGCADAAIDVVQVRRASRIASAGRRRGHPRQARGLCAAVRRRDATCSTSAAAAASSWTCCARPASARAASTRTTRWSRSVARAASTWSKATCFGYLRPDCPTARSAVSSPFRSSSTSSRTT